MSTGEKVAVAVAVALNQPEWLTEYGYTIPEAIDRTSPAWVSMIPKVAHDSPGEDAMANNS